MKKKKKEINIKKMVDPIKIRSLGITKDIVTEIDQSESQKIIGGKDTDPTVVTQWPTKNN